MANHGPSNLYTQTSRLAMQASHYARMSTAKVDTNHCRVSRTAQRPGLPSPPSFPQQTVLDKGASV